MYKDTKLFWTYMLRNAGLEDLFYAKVKLLFIHHDAQRNRTTSTNSNFLLEFYCSTCFYSAGDGTAAQFYYASIGILQLSSWLYWHTTDGNNSSEYDPDAYLHPHDKTYSLHIHYYLSGWSDMGRSWMSEGQSERRHFFGGRVFSFDEHYSRLILCCNGRWSIELFCS
jgi:hypothetical protein